MPLNTQQALAAKARSEQRIARAGGRICEWLPILERGQMRSQEEVIARALIMNALLNIHFKAPIPIIKNWIEAQGLTLHLSEAEKILLEKRNEDLTPQEEIDLYWYIESLWALMWAGSLIADLPFNQPVPDTMASLCPDLQRNEDGAKFTRQMFLRSPSEVFEMLDLYYRVHWYAEDGRINGYSTGDIDLDIVMERRKALEWIMDTCSDWDDMSLNT